MSDKKQKPGQSGSADTASPDRRKVIKGLVLGGTVVTASQWTKPVVEAVILPAHAQSISITARGGGTNNFPGNVNPGP